MKLIKRNKLNSTILTLGSSKMFGAVKTIRKVESKFVRLSTNTSSFFLHKRIEI